MFARSIISTALSLTAILPLMLATEASAATPSCEQAAATVNGRFARNMRSYLQTDLSIAEFGPITENRLELTDETHRVERRYCHSTVTTSDGARRQLWFLVEGTWGFAGVGHSVEFCTSGLDRWHVYGAHCKSLR